MYNAQYFIDFVNENKDRLIVNSFDNNEGKGCINGLLGTRDFDNPSEASRALKKVLEPLDIHYSKDYWEVGEKITDYEFYSRRSSALNNGWVQEYQQPTIHERLIAALTDAQKFES